MHKISAVTRKWVGCNIFLKHLETKFALCNRWKQLRKNFSVFPSTLEDQLQKSLKRKCEIWQSEDHRENSGTLGMVPEFSLWEYVKIIIQIDYIWLPLITWLLPLVLLLNQPLSRIPSCENMYVVWSIALKPRPSCQWTIVEGWFSNIHTMTCGDGWILGLSRDIFMVKDGQMSWCASILLMMSDFLIQRYHTSS